MKKRYEDGIVPQMNQDIRADFARQIRALRQSQHLTQQVLADRRHEEIQYFPDGERQIQSLFGFYGTGGCQHGEAGYDHNRG